MKLKDYKKTDYCNENEPLAYAIEPEVSYEFYNSQLADYDYKAESSNIYELIGVHHETEFDKMYILDTINGYYKDFFPVGEDGFLSGGTHFCMFGDFSHLEYNNTLKYKLLNCPLFLKIKNNVMYSRYILERCNFNGCIIYGTKHRCISLKDTLLTNNEECLYSPIEFRCNNVVDSRILGYYQGVLLADEKNVKFKKTSEEFREYASKGDNEFYNCSGDLPLEEINGYILKKEDLKVIRHNVKIILNLLKEEGLINSAKALKEYLNENGIKYI